MNAPKGFGFHRPSVNGPGQAATTTVETPPEPEILGDELTRTVKSQLSGSRS